MNIIIVAKPGARPTCLNLRCWKARLRIGAAIASCAIGCAAIGFAAALFVSNPSERALSIVRSLSGEIAGQRLVVWFLFHPSPNVLRIARTLGSTSGRNGA